MEVDNASSIYERERERKREGKDLKPCMEWIKTIVTFKVNST